jgi:hypothetical protein
MLENIELLENRKPENLTSDQLSLLSGIILNRYEKWREACAPFIQEIKKIRKYIYQSQKGEYTEGDPYALPAIYKLNETIISLIKENVYATNAGVFDVRGKDKQSQETANLHKWDIVNDLEKINFAGKKAKAFLKSYTETGEMIALVGLSTTTVKRKTEVEVPEMVTGLAGEKLETPVMKVGIMDMEIQDGVEVYPIKPEDFYFDTTKIDRFDSPVCGKIIRKWLSYDEIIGNKSYELFSKKIYGKEVKEYLKQSIKGQEPSEEMLTEDVGLWDANKNMINGDLAEVLDYRGNIIVDGKELKNYLITLIAGKVVRCIPDPFYNNTIVYYPHDIHPEYKRGISPLRVGLRSADITSNIINEIITAFPYIALPVSYAPKGSVKDKKEKPPPGGRIEYETDLNKNPPIPIDASGTLKGFDLVEFFNNQTEAAVGVSSAMMGQPEEKKKTATEVKAMQVGGSVRISEMIDGIKQGFNIPLIKKIADMKANFEDGDIPVGVVQGDGNVKEETITDEIRTGKYDYIYTDSKATMERQAQFKDVLSLIELAVKVDPGLIDMKEIIKYGFLQTGMQDVEKFLNKDQLEEGIRQILQQLGLKDDPATMDAAKAKVTEYLPMLAQVIISEQRTMPPQAISEPRMGTMPSDIQRGGLPPVR